MEELVNCDTQTIAKLFDRGYGGAVIASADDIIYCRLRYAAYAA